MARVRLRIFVVICIAVILPFRGVSQDAAGGRRTDDTTQPPEERTGPSFLPLPILFYTPETGIGGGAALLFVDRTPNLGTRPSSVIVDVIYTQKRQVILEAYPRLHLGNPGYHLLGEIKFSRYPEKFFGIGNDTPERLEELFTSRMFRLAVDALRDLWDGIDAGISTYYETRTLFDLDSHGLLIPATIRGSRGGTTMGLGLIARWDTRDNEFAPLNGRFYQLTWKRSSPKIGSDFDFSYLTADLREFFPLGDESVLGIQALATLVGGEAPFYLLAELGGSNSMRGYYEGRYRDDVSLATQAEYRFPLLARLRGSAFVGIGDVARTLSGFTLRMAKPTYGFGLRYVYDPRARLIIRVDMGFGRGSSGLYVTVHEAF